MLKYIDKLFWKRHSHKEVFGYLVKEMAGGEIEELLKKFPKSEIVNLLFKILDPPKQNKMGEMEELMVLSEVSNEKFKLYLENREYDELTAHITEDTPEMRLMRKGRHSAWSELKEKLSVANQELVEKDIEQAARKVDNEE